MLDDESKLVYRKSVFRSKNLIKINTDLLTLKYKTRIFILFRLIM